jgi:hypothetical protein
MAAALIVIAVAALAETNTLSVTLNTNAWEIGNLPPCGIADTWCSAPGTFSVSNDGTVAADIYITVSNSTPAGWLPAEEPGTDTFRMGYNIEQGAFGPSYCSAMSTPGIMTQALDTNAVMNFDLEFRAPSETGQIGVEQQIRVTIIAIEAE